MSAIVSHFRKGDLIEKMGTTYLILSLNPPVVRNWGLSNQVEVWNIQTGSRTIVDETNIRSFHILSR